jgi:hypothetical protein
MMSQALGDTPRAPRGRWIGRWKLLASPTDGKQPLRNQGIVYAIRNTQYA